MKAYSCGSCRIVTWKLDCFKVWRVLTESDVCLSGRAERKHLARRRLEFFSLLLSSVILCHPHSLVSAVKSLSLRWEMSACCRLVQLCVLGSQEIRRYVCWEGRKKTEMAFISFVFKWNSPDFSLLSDTLINSSMLSLYIRAWAERTAAKQTNLILLPWERFPRTVGI